MIIKFIKEHKIGIKANSVYTVDDLYGNRMIEEGYAIRIDKEDKPIDNKKDKPIDNKKEDVKIEVKPIVIDNKMEKLNTNDNNIIEVKKVVKRKKA